MPCSLGAECDMGRVIEPGRLTSFDRARVVLCAAHSRLVHEAMEAAEWERVLRLLGAFSPLPPAPTPVSPPARRRRGR